MEMFLELSFQLLCDDQLNSNSSAAVVTAWNHFTFFLLHPGELDTEQSWDGMIVICLVFWYMSHIMYLISFI